MLRIIRIYASASIPDAKTIVYHARGVRPITQYRKSLSKASSTTTGSVMTSAYVEDDFARFTTSANIWSTMLYEWVVDISDNQPVQEAVEEVTNKGVIIEVYNENGVLICDNGLTPTSSAMLAGDAVKQDVQSDAETGVV